MFKCPKPFYCPNKKNYIYNYLCKKPVKCIVSHEDNILKLAQ